jgi:hypothetical protein
MPTTMTASGYASAGMGTSRKKAVTWCQLGPGLSEAGELTGLFECLAGVVLARRAASRETARAVEVMFRANIAGTSMVEWLLREWLLR